MAKLTKIQLTGYKSFRDETVPFMEDVTVLLGANGAGKSNLVSFFKMLNYMTTGGLQLCVSERGGSDSFLHYGRQTTLRTQANIYFETEGATTCYTLQLVDAAPDTLIFTNEHCTYSRTGFSAPQEIPLGVGHKESNLKRAAQDGDHTCRVLYGMLSQCRAFQFHDTSESAHIRKSRYVEDTSYLRHDAGNLAPYLRAMREVAPGNYQRLIDTIRLVYPFFDDFELKPSGSNENYLLLNWREKEHPDYLMGPHQLSDGTLRFMALATLFLQPQENMPALIVLDEPELGLHPCAVSVLGGLIRSAAVNSQIVLATQSTRLVDEFESNQIVVFERDEQGGTQCHDLDQEQLSEWLQEYSLGELWEKNIFGGRP